MSNYGKVYAVGKREVADIFDGYVEIQEKIDGSQFSFGVNATGRWFASKNTVLNPDATGQFAGAIAKVRDADLLPDHIYYGEAVTKPRHNVFTYATVPGVVLFDIETPLGGFFSSREVEAEAKQLRLWVVPTYFRGESASIETAQSFLARESSLGGTLIEGVVIKSPDGRRAKLVRDEFKETAHQSKSQADIIATIAATFGTPMRYAKAMQHLRDDGHLPEGDKAIGPTIREVQNDVETECADEIKEMLYAYYRKDILRDIVKGVPAYVRAQ